MRNTCIKATLKQPPHHHGRPGNEESWLVSETVVGRGAGANETVPGVSGDKALVFLPIYAPVH